MSRSPWPSRLARLEEAGWRVVMDSEFTRTPGRQIVVYDRFFSCHLPAGPRGTAIIYSAAARDLLMSDFEATFEAWFALQRYLEEPYALLSDMRLLGSSDGRLTALMQALPKAMEQLATTIRRYPRRGLALLPEGASRYFWAGAIPHLDHSAVGLFTDPDEVWRLLEATPEEREACELAAEIVFGEGSSGITERIAQRLDTEPGLELMAIAKELGMSPRSLQRRLSDEGVRFAELREQARLRRAVVLVESGAKVETIAREVGFASTSHFIQWFRKHNGQTPGERRATPKT